MGRSNLEAQPILMHGVAPRMCDKPHAPLLGGKPGVAPPRFFQAPQATPAGRSVSPIGAPIFLTPRTVLSQKSVNWEIMRQRRRRGMSAINAFVAKTIKWFLIIAGVATGLALVFAIDIELFTPLFGGLIDYTPSSVPALRHWGIMIFGLGALMVAAAFRPWLRFETMLFCMVEKGFVAYLFLSNLGQPWV